MGEELAKVLMNDKTFKEVLATCVVTSLTDEVKTRVLSSFIDEVMKKDHRGIAYAVERAVGEVIAEMAKAELAKPKRQRSMSKRRWRRDSRTG